MKKEIYVDHNSTGLLSAAHLSKVFEKISLADGNPSSIHAKGRNAKAALEDSRTALSKLLGAQSSEILFTSGATEANNMVIQGLCDHHDTHVIISSAEHSSVIEPSRLMVERGFCTLSEINPTNLGHVTDEAFLDFITPKTKLVCLIHANNEVGSINSIEQIARTIKSKFPGIHFHSDMVQSLGRLDLTWLGKSLVDSASFSAHKIGAFKGIGALYLKAGTKLKKFLAGGGQERSRRPGTENIPGIISFGLRCQDILRGDAWIDAVRGPSLELLEGLKKLEGVKIHGEPERGLINTINFHVEGVGGDDMLINFDLNQIFASSGSACSSGVGRPSHVLKAMGYSDWIALNSVRISFGPGNTKEDSQSILKVLSQVIERNYRTRK